MRISDWSSDVCSSDLPALMTVARSPRIWRVRPSAIWLRAELATQRKRMRFIVGFLPRLLDGLAVAADGGAGLVPALAGVHDLHDRARDRHLDEHTDHGGESRARSEEQTAELQSH